MHPFHRSNTPTQRRKLRAYDIGTCRNFLESSVESDSPRTWEATSGCRRTVEQSESSVVFRLKNDLAFVLWTRHKF